jgi:hypothetical protein
MKIILPSPRRCPIGLLASVLLATSVPLAGQETNERNEIRREVRAAVEEAAAAAREAARTWSWSWTENGDRAKGEPEPYIGVTIEAVPRALRRYVDLPSGVGLLLVSVHENSPAHKAGLEDDDIMVEFAGQLIVNFDQFSTLVNLHQGGDKVPLKVLRKGGEVEVELVIEERVRQGRRWAPAPPAPPAPPASGGPPAPPAPPVGQAPRAGEIGEEVARWVERLPRNVRVVTGEGNTMEVDLSQLKSDLGSLEDALRGLEWNEEGGRVDVQSLVERLHELKTVVIGSPEEGPRQSIVHLGETVFALQNDEGKVRLFVEGERRKALVTDPQGVVLFDGEVPTKLEEADLDPRARRLIETLLQASDDVRFDFGNGPSIPVELEVEEAA